MTIRGLLIAINNWLVRHVRRRVRPANLLVLLPRCLQHAGCGQDVIEDLAACRQCGAGLRFKRLMAITKCSGCHRVP